MIAVKEMPRSAATVWSYGITVEGSMLRRFTVMLLAMLLMATPFASASMACAIAVPGASAQHDMHLRKVGTHHGKDAPVAPTMKSCAILTCAVFQATAPTEIPRFVPQVMAGSFDCRMPRLAGHCPVPRLGPPRNQA